MRLSQRQEKRGRYSRFSAVEDLIITKEVVAIKAHVASYGTVSRSFEEAPEKANANPGMKEPVTAKCAQDRYKRLRFLFDRSDNRDRNRSGVGGEIMKMDEILLMMREERDDLEETRRAQKKTVSELYDKKERVGRKSLSMTTSRRKSNVNGETMSSYEGESATPKHRKKAHMMGDLEEMERFALQMREADFARIELDNDKLASERERFDLDAAEKEKIERNVA